MAGLHETLGERERNRERIQRDAPDLFTAFSGLIASNMKPGLLDRNRRN